jgi:hypothetical protein
MTEPTEKTAKAPMICRKLVAIMADMEALGKDRKNVQQGYNFRGIDDVYNMVQPIMAKHGVFMRSSILDERSEDRPSKSGGTLIYRILRMRYGFIAEDGSEVNTDVIGEGMDSGDKATNKAMSVAQKYAILQMFMIPTEDPKDPENDSPQAGQKAAAKPAASTKPATTKPAESAKAPVKTGPITDAQSARILDLVTAFQVVSGWSEQELSVAINKSILKKYKVEIAGVKDLTEDMATFLISELKRWGEAWLEKHPAPDAGGSK